LVWPITWLRQRTTAFLAVAEALIGLVEENPLAVRAAGSRHFGGPDHEIGRRPGTHRLPGAAALGLRPGLAFGSLRSP
jgi:hypothetical protein